MFSTIENNLTIIYLRKLQESVERNIDSNRISIHTLRKEYEKEETSV
jgi:hypothetical protein